MTLTDSDPISALDRGDHAGAITLSLAGCGLTALPDSLRALSGSLRVLDLAGNRLTALPHWLSEFTELRVLFGSANPFAALPEVLGACPALSQIGFRGCGMTHLPPAALPPALRWLTLTDNALTELPASLGERGDLRKLLLAGNRLRTLPEAMAAAAGLELVRISANAFDSLPGWLPRLPRLAWLAWGGNPAESVSVQACQPRTVRWTDLVLGPRLGEGSSGEVHEVDWPRGEPAGPVVLKLFKGHVSSDGLTQREIDAALAVGDADGLIGGLAGLAGHPRQRPGLLMPRVAPHWRVLGGPPSPSSCTRDVYPPDRRFTLAQMASIATRVGRGAAALHRAGYAHGDLYAHNILYDPQGSGARLGDLGAASALPHDPVWAVPDLRAWAILAEELLDRCPEPWPEARALVSSCLTGSADELVALGDAVCALAALTPP
ncbi:hypothetical protein FHR90_002273 [Endobacter medicaginis]|uniref:Protein kinase domain-containing protein n=3 Tax=Endobacter medicaginis TaxID=1181271 RepID=A0A839V4F9_9PROT|nr:hypothetical protein [Endobacter medicaginis]MCX5475283.1 hypothetical protein [Endobacter medicaginis]